MTFNPLVHRLNRTQIAAATPLELLEYILARAQRPENRTQSWIDIIDLTRELRARTGLPKADARKIIMELEDISASVQEIPTLRAEILETSFAVRNSHPGSAPMAPA